MKTNLHSTAAIPPSCSYRDPLVADVMTLVGPRVLSLPGREPGRRIRVVEGSLWVTEEGDRHDYLVGAGETFFSGGHGQVVFQSVTPASRFVFIPAPA